MVAEAVGFMMSRAADGGTMAPELVTRDFLGGCQAPAAGDDPRHDAAVPGKPPLQKHLSPPPSTRGDLNLFPVSGAAMAPAATMAQAADSATTTTYHSVCTIEKVKTALERFERGKQGQHHHQQHSGAGAGASPSSSSVTTSSVKRRGDAGAVEQGDGCDSPSASAGGGGMVAAACPRCFLYVLIARSDPRCPRCESHVPPPPAPAPKKKPRIDLNVGFLGT